MSYALNFYKSFMMTFFRLVSLMQAILQSVYFVRKVTIMEILG